MATILNSKLIQAGEKSFARTVEEFEEWYGKILEDGRACYITLQRVLLDEERQKKNTAWSELDVLVADRLAEDKLATWANGMYWFNFATRKYEWNHKSIYMTASEALFLFRWLVLDDEVHKVQWYFLHNMRKRLGESFLREVRP